MGWVGWGGVGWGGVGWGELGPDLTLQAQPLKDVHTPGQVSGGILLHKPHQQLLPALGLYSHSYQLGQPVCSGGCNIWTSRALRNQKQHLLMGPQLCELTQTQSPGLAVYRPFCRIHTEVVMGRT